MCSSWSQFSLIPFLSPAVWAVNCLRVEPVDEEQGQGDMFKQHTCMKERAANCMCILHNRWSNVIEMKTWRRRKEEETNLYKHTQWRWTFWSLFVVFDWKVTINGLLSCASQLTLSPSWWLQNKGRKTSLHNMKRLHVSHSAVTVTMAAVLCPIYSSVYV